jgi:hypothetical protein
MAKLLDFKRPTTVTKDDLKGKAGRKLVDRLLAAGATLELDRAA